MHAWSRHFICLSVLAVLVALPTLALAQDEITMEIRLPNEDGKFVQTDERDIPEYFNRVQCECESDFEVRFQLAEGADPATYNGEQVDIYLGAMCDDPERQPDCLLTDKALPDYGDLNLPNDQQYSVRDLITLRTRECGEGNQEGSQNIWALVDVEGDGAYESTSTLPVDYDVAAPALPDDITTRGGEEAILIDFNVPDSNDDLFTYQVLCAKVDDPGKAVKDEAPGAQYDRAEDVVGCNSDFQIPMTDVDPVVVPADLIAANPAFICGEGESSSDSIRVEGLENDVEYHVVLMAIDAQRNAQGIYLGIAAPRPAVDFWEIYKRNGGKAEGGCNSGGTAGWLGLLVVGLFLIRLGAKRALPLLLLVALPSMATAQPYWDELDEEVGEEGASIPAWNFGIKFAPYTPDIDSEFDGVGPFERTFGAKAGLMTQFELERFFLYPLGQLGVSAMVGLQIKSNEAFEEAEDGSLRRADGEKTGFKLVPTAISAVYRFTELDTRFGIPIVPYGKLGLSYYYWVITKPNGDVSETMDDGKGKGGSLGWQGSLGFAIRAERFDETAARSLRNEFGVEHAGLYAELSYAKVDGFGSDTKLSVGDFTWFAGVNFEF